MKFVYVLTSSNNDYFYEQLYLSITSIKYHNPDAYIILLVDKKTKQNLVEKRKSYEKIISEIIIISPPVEYNQKEISRWIKTSIPNYVSDDFLFIDCDTIITEPLGSGIFFDMQIGAVLDTHVTLENHHLREYFRKEDKKAGFSSSIKSNKRFNGGVIYCKNSDCAFGFFDEWHSLWKEGMIKGCSQDMPSFNQANINTHNIITELPGEWNCQISHNGLPYLSIAKIIHYYATSLVSFEPALIFASLELLASIKDTGELSYDIIKRLENPKSAFEPLSRIISDKTVIDTFDSSAFSKLIWFNRRYPNIFKKLDYFITFLTKIIKNI
ncbi:MAG: hypothetical protein FWG99_03865 [Treponema sp.]|nr:hypothetical protein [Treponema sp.]